MHDREAHDREVYTQLRPSSRPCRPVPSSPSLLCPASLPFTNRTNRCTAVSVGSSATHAKQLKNSASAESSEGFQCFHLHSRTQESCIYSELSEALLFFFFFLSSSFFSFTSCPRRISQLPTASAFLLIVRIFFFTCFHIFQHFKTIHTSSASFKHFEIFFLPLHAFKKRESSKIALL